MKPLLYPIASDDHIFGSPAASLELLEYGDYECTYCGLAYLTVKVIQRQLGSDVKCIILCMLTTHSDQADHSFR